MSETLGCYDVGDRPDCPQPSTQKLDIQLEQVALLTIDRQSLPLERLALILAQVLPRDG
ncbi:MAG TPA: hypothetical protein V6D11_11375 [Waterburya sp.]|jgi:hypothetical protein